MGTRRRTSPKRLGAKLRQIREALGLSQAGLVRRLRYTDTPLHPSQISNYEQGKREPPLSLLLAYARLAQIPLELLADDKLSLPDILPAVPESNLVMPLPFDRGKKQEGR